MSAGRFFSQFSQTISDAKMFGRFAIGLPRFLRSRICPKQCPELLQKHLERREESFLNLVKRAVYENPASPYRKLLEAVGVDFEQIADLVSREGIEATLGQLFDAGVFVTLDEFKGRQAIRRVGLECRVRAGDFDNPLLSRHFEGSTGGSRGAGTRLVVDLDLVAVDSLMHSLFLQAFNLGGRPMALWRPLPPGVAGIKKTFMEAKLGRGIERWFCQNRHQFTPANVKYATFLTYALCMSRICGARFPRPEFVPVTQSEKLAEWLAEKVGAGTPGHLDTNASCAVRVLQAAKEKGLDVSGSFFRVGGEPYTSAKAKLVAEAGCDAAVHYSMGEAGHIGVACGDPNHLDDVHLVTHKMAVLKRPIRTSTGKFDAFYLTTLATVCPKIMLNVAIGDSGVLEERKCSCAIGELGFHQHIHSIRSYEKLTSEGMQFLGSDLLLLLEQVLPSQFGGGPQDYQFVEREEEGVTRVELVVSRRLGPLRESELSKVALDFLGSRARENRMMVERWKEGRTLVVRRSEPYVTKAAKLLPLHIMAEDR